MLAFVGGLYFVLEFLLPVKYGGDFDSYEVGSPTPLVTRDGTVILYTGRYAGKDGSVGRAAATRARDGAWARSPEEPVLKRSPFSAVDNAGMEQLAAVPDGDRPWLLYLGLNLDGARTLCASRGNADGTRWTRTDPVRFYVSGVPIWSIDQPNGLMPELQGTLQFFSAHRSGGLWYMLLVLNTPGVGNRIVAAEGATLSAMRVRVEPICAAAKIPVGLTAFDARLTRDGWELDMVAGSVLSRLMCRADGSNVDLGHRNLATSDTTVTALRRGAADTLYLARSKRAPEQTPEASPNETEIAVLAAASGSSAMPVLKTGRQPSPTYLSRASELAGDFVAILGAFPVFLAMVNLSIYHGKKTVKANRESVYSLVFFACLAAMFVFTMKGRGEYAVGTSWRAGYDFMFNGILQPVTTAVFSMITFYMISAAYRSFRVRSVESLLLMLAAAIVMLGQTPLGEWTSHLLPGSLAFLGLPVLSQKLLTVVNASAARGVMIGMAIGALAISIRIWLGTDSSAYAGLGEDS